MIPVSLPRWMYRASRFGLVGTQSRKAKWPANVHPQIESLESRDLLSTITDLGTLGGGFSAAYGINAYGQVVGNSSNSQQTHAFLYSDNVMTDLGSPPNTDTVAYGVNNYGQAVGLSYRDHPFSERALLYSDGQITDLGDLGGLASSANAINDAGQIVGSSEIPITRYTHAFIYSDGQMTDLEAPGDFSSAANGINNSGQIVGDYSVSSSYHAFLYCNGEWTDLGTLGGRSSAAYAINDNGQVVGSADVDQNQSDAFLYSDGTMIDLGGLGGTHSYAASVNNYGQVVGYAELPGNGSTHGFFYDNGTLTDLNDLLPVDSGWVINDARGINDAGQIVGGGILNGEFHAFLMTLDGASPGIPGDGETSHLTAFSPNSHHSPNAVDVVLASPAFEFSQPLWVDFASSPMVATIATGRAASSLNQEQGHYGSPGNSQESQAFRLPEIKTAVKECGNTGCVERMDGIGSLNKDTIFSGLSGAGAFDEA